MLAVAFPAARYNISMTAPTIDVPVLEGDDVGFVQAVRDALTRELTTTHEVYVVKLDQWFGRKWFEFSGKAMGALGVWRRSVTVPPFHPHRVIFERHFEWDGRRRVYAETKAPHVLHIHQVSERNLNRRLETFSASGSFIWYSGDTRRSGRGSLMVYVIDSGEGERRYTEFIRTGDTWRAAASIH